MTTSATHATETLLFFTLLQLAVIVLAARLGGVIAQRVGQSTAVGEIIVGILLGPSLFGALAPDTFALVFRSTPPQPLTILSQIGLLMLMFQIGLEFDFAHLTEQRNRRSVWWVAVAGMLAPFGLALLLARLMPVELTGSANPLAFSLFMATAFSITALPILGRIMIEFDLTRTSLGVIAISAAAINDVVGWLMLAMVTALSVAQFSPLSFGVNVAMVGVFIAAAWFIVRPLYKKFLARQSLATRPMSNTVLGVTLACMFAAGMTTYQLGIFAIFGGFMFGVLLHDETAFVAQWKERVGQFVNVFFLPIFFTYTGLRTDIGSLASVESWLWCAAVIAMATLGKFGGCYLAARISGLDHRQSQVIGIMMNTRALMELIVLNVGLDLGVITREVFTMLVLMAIFSTVVTTPGLRRWLPALGLGPRREAEPIPAVPAGR
ncbi:hypothetical protein BH09PSE6_BH09PSE6_09050 [soil metagenome]